MLVHVRPARSNDTPQYFLYRSAMFNILIIVALSAVLSGQVSNLLSQLGFATTVTYFLIRNFRP